MGIAIDTPLISAEQIDQFHRDGFCVVSGLFNSTEIQDIEDFFEEYKSVGERVFDGGLGYEEIDPSQRQLRAMHPHRHSKKAQDWLLNPRVNLALEAILGEEALAAQSMYYFKPPGARGQGMHQDNFYLLAKPATCIAAWTAIDDCTIENGCLYVVPGSHREDILCPSERSKERWFNYGDSHIGKFPRDSKPIPVPVPRGSTMFFGGNTIHGSGPNKTTDKWRRTFIGHYINQTSEQVSRFYHPILNKHGEVVSTVERFEGGGPCGDNWQGATH